MAVSAGAVWGAITSSAGIAAVGATAAGATAISANKQAKAQQAAQKRAAETAEKASIDAERATKRAEAKTPDLATLLTRNQAGGGGSTMLTGAAGIDPDKLLLGRSTLLGG